MVGVIPPKHLQHAVSHPTNETTTKQPIETGNYHCHVVVHMEMQEQVDIQKHSTHNSKLYRYLQERNVPHMPQTQTNCGRTFKILGSKPLTKPLYVHAVNVVNM